MKNINSIKNSTLASAIALSLTAFSAEAKPSKPVPTAVLDSEIILSKRREDLLTTIDSLQRQQLELVIKFFQLVEAEDLSKNSATPSNRAFVHSPSAKELSVLIRNDSEEESVPKIIKHALLLRNILEKKIRDLPEPANADEAAITQPQRKSLQGKIDTINKIMEEFNAAAMAKKSAEEDLLIIDDSMSIERKKFEALNPADRAEKTKRLLTATQEFLEKRLIETEKLIHLEQEKIEHAENIIAEYYQSLPELFKRIFSITKPLHYLKFPPIFDTDDFEKINKLAGIRGIKINRWRELADQIVDKVSDRICDTIHSHYKKIDNALGRLSQYLEKKLPTEDMLTIESMYSRIQTQTETVKEVEAKLLDEFQNMRIKRNTAQRQKEYATTQIRALEDTRKTVKNSAEADIEYGRTILARAEAELPSASASVSISSTPSLSTKEWQRCARFVRHAATTIPPQELKRSLGTGRKTAEKRDH